MTAAAENPPSPSGRTPDSGDLRGKEHQEGWSVPLDRVDAFTLGAPIAVEPERIEQELQALWRKAAERARSAGEGTRFTVTRACLWNFISHSDGDEEFQRTKQLVDELSESVPARFVNIYENCETATETQGGAAPLLAFIEANFRRAGGRREVLAEEITLESPQTAVHRLPALVRSLLLADLPTALFVRNPVEENHWLPRLAAEADRFIFDSGKLADGAALRRLVQQLGKLYPGGRSELADLGWLRLWPWRMLLASLFDPQPALSTLRELGAVEIEHAATAEPAALLLAGWLTRRLKLSAGTLKLSVAPPLDGGPVGITRVTLRCGAHVFTAQSAGERGVRLESPFQPERVQPISPRPDAELMVAAMGVGGRDPLMYEALRLGERLVRADG
jgi:glucose-6-phosphate dehydrogenase assembly protein OpcA